MACGAGYARAADPSFHRLKPQRALSGKLVPENLVAPSRSVTLERNTCSQKGGRTPMIYFCHDEIFHAIKIGKSVKPQKRLGQLQTGNPHKLRILGKIPGGEKEEG